MQKRWSDSRIDAGFFICYKVVQLWIYNGEVQVFMYQAQYVRLGFRGI